MTSRPSRPRPSSGSRARLLTAAAVLAWAGGAAADASAPRESRGGVEIDWGLGTLSASGGAAADLRMPSADLARPGALRQARAAALAKLRAVLADLPLGGGRTLAAAAVERALGRARAGAVEYQSNGGALVQVTVRFADWIDGGPPAGGPDAGAAEGAPVAVLSVPAMHLAAAPEVKLAGREAALGAAQYRIGVAPASANALPARADRSDRLLLDADPDLGRKLARGLVLIYVQKVLR